MTTQLQEKTYRVLLGESNTDEWLRLRKLGVGASEAAAVLGDSAWGTPRTVYDQKIDPEIVDFTTDLMEFGHLAEPLIVAFLNAHPERFAWMGEIIPAEGLLQSVQWPHLLGTLDRRVRTPLGLIVPLELKSVNDFIASEWRVGGGEAGDEQASWGTRYEVPKKYQIQVQSQMAVIGAPFAYVAVWLGKDHVEVIRVERDDDYISEFLIGRVGDFWHYNVEARIPPAATLNDDLWKIWPGDLGLDPIVADEDLIDEIGKWRVATTDARDLSKEIKQLKFNITDKMGDSCSVVDPMTKKVIHTLKPQNTARGCDFDKLAIMYPDAYEDCVRPAGRTRVHRATKEPVG